MRIPKYLLKTPATIKPLKGNGAYGEVYGTLVRTKCHVEYKRKLIVNSLGEQIVSEATAFFPPDVEITVGSLVTVHGNKMKVVGVKPFYLSNKMSHLEVNLQ